MFGWRELTRGTVPPSAQREGGDDLVDFESTASVTAEYAWVLGEVLAPQRVAKVGC